jgi:mRNA interferase RelE/StbE
VNYVIEFSPTAARQLKKLSSVIRCKIILAIENLAINPRPMGYKKLVADVCYRVRVSNYRIIYSIIDKTVTIFILKIAHRREVY